MSVAFRSAAVANSGSSPASSLAINMPAGATINDNLIVSIAVDGGSGATVTPPSGWTVLKIENALTNIQCVMYWRLCTGTEPSSYTWTFDSSRMASGNMAAYSGATPNFPVAIGQTNNSSLSTSLTPAGGTNYTYSGAFVYGFATKNTVGSASITAASPITKRSDTCTAASDYIESAIGDWTGIAALPISGSTGNVQACSQSVYYSGGVVFLEDAHQSLNQIIHTPLVIDSYFGSTSGSGTSLTPNSAQPMAAHYNNELLVIFVKIRNGSTTVSSISGGGLTWTLAKRQNTGGGSSEIWYAFSPTPQVPFTPTVTFSASTTSVEICGLSIIGVDSTGTNGSGAIGNTAGATSSSAAPTVNLTTSRAGSWVFACSNDPSAATNFVAGTSQSLIKSATDGTNSCSGGTLQQTSPTANLGTTITSNFTAPSANSCNIVAIEILPRLTSNNIPMLV